MRKTRQERVLCRVVFRKDLCERIRVRARIRTGDGGFAIPTIRAYTMQTFREPWKPPGKHAPRSFRVSLSTVREPGKR